MKYLFLFFNHFFIIFNLLGQATMTNPCNEIFKGTTIIISVQNNQIIIAADSKQTKKSDLLDDDSNVPLKCKIRNTGNLFFAGEGYLSMTNPYIDFLEIIESFDLSEKKNFNDKIAYIENKLRDPVNQYVYYFQKNHPLSFSKILNRTLLTIIFSTFENNKPICLALNWDIKSNIHGWEAVLNRAESELIPRYMVQGQNSAIEKHFQENQSSLNKLFFVSGILELMNLQINETPEMVGGPIDIVVLTPDGFNWVQKKEQCK